MIDLKDNYNNSNFSKIFDNLLLNLNSNYYYNLESLVLNMKIFYKNKEFIFNPWYETFFKDTSLLLQSFKHANNLFKIRFISTPKVPAHSVFESYLNKFNNKELTVLYQSSNIWRPIASKSGELKSDIGLVTLDKGVLNKIGVHDFRPVTIDKNINNINLSNVNFGKINNVSLQKQQAFKTFLLGLYKKDLVIEENQIVESVSYSFYIDRLFSMYNNELSDESYDAIKYLLEFCDTYIQNEPIKIEAWEFFFSKIIFNENNEAIIPNLEKKDLSLKLQNYLDDKDI